ncbi:MAG TPA: hypothetical protein VL527_03300 [Dongiaceae bacterium]|nr:hypothetical protein [Dongiaceae bacterium]
MNPNPESLQLTRRQRRLRLIGGIILLVGLLGAGGVFWWGERALDLSADPATVGYARAQQRQMGLLFGGKWGGLSDDLTAALKRPGTQAVIILAVTGLAAWACFHSAKPLESDEPPAS